MAWGMLIGCVKGKALVALCEERLATADNARTRYLLAKAHLELEQTGQAEQQLRTGLRSDGQDTRTLLGLAALLMRREDTASLAEAGQLLKQARKLLDVQKDAALKNDAAALGGFFMILSGESQETAVLQESAKAFCQRSQCALQKKELHRALQLCELAMRLDPKHPDAYYQKAACLALQGKTEPAIASLVKAIELGYSDFQQIVADRSLNSIRNEPGFLKLFEQQKK
jgi:Flp pilus assembly protein TadD